ncbi:Mis6-domain-containing protein [Nadsonia fulvescens var. elongata DSM 6958]|uniref:Mis6-domain-containing protein n=1 Tax=Nadsonia fulvescens var. elongata DSM 6958 TaxID=857566 RepID=A0A1E3PEY2_9ASCO|nr:Mis6-domain-containing protein [Nadsonia fulvescens var. elongata DSM 6958]
MNTGIEETKLRKEQISKAINRISLARDIKLSKEEIDICYRTIRNYSPLYGLSIPNLKSLVETFTHPSTTLPSSVISSIINSYLSPREVIPDSIVIKIVSSCGTGAGKAQLRVQTLLLRWLVIVIPYLENKSILKKLYGVLFSLLSVEATRTWVIYLLFKSTTRELVRPWRADYLQELREKYGDNQYVLGLLYLYHTYYSGQIILSNAHRLSSNLFANPDLDYERRIASLQTYSSSQPLNDQTCLITNSNRFQATGRLKRQRQIIPDFNYGSSKVYKGAATTPGAKISADRILDLRNFVYKLEKIDMPMQIGSVLREIGTVTRVLVNRGNYSIWKRLNIWLTDALCDPTLLPNDLESLLTSSLNITRYTKDLLFPIEEFLYHYVPIWNGTDYSEVIWNLLCFLPSNNTDRLLTNILEPLFSLSTQDLEHSDNIRERFFRFLTDLLSYWDIRYSPLFGKNAINPALEEITLGIQTLVQFVNSAATLALRILEDSVKVQHEILLFLEVLNSTKFVNDRPTAYLVSPSLYYQLMFNLSPSTYSRFCGVISTIKPIITEFAKSNQNDPVVGFFNSLVMDNCNVLWRGRAFNSQDKSSRGCDIYSGFLEDLKRLIAERGSENLEILFNLSYSPLWSRKCALHFRALENAHPEISARHDGPVSSQSLATLSRRGGLEISILNFRIDFLKQLDNEGFTGINEFLYSSMKNLMSAKKSSL